MGESHLLDELEVEFPLPPLTELQHAVFDFLMAYNRGDKFYCDGDVIADMHVALEKEGVDVDGALRALKAAGKDKYVEPPLTPPMLPGIAVTKLAGGGTAYVKL